MASLLDEHVPEFETIEDQLNYWIQKCYDIDERYQSLSRKYKQLLARTSDQSSQPPPKKPKEDNTSTDPLEVLAEPIFHRIMGYLNSQELRDAMRVSKGWKKYIEETNSLMTRATNGKVDLLVEPDLRDTLPDGLHAFTDRKMEKRDFKHMEVPIWSDFTTKISLLPCYAPTLETLTVNGFQNETANKRRQTGHVGHDNSEETLTQPIERCDFPNLTSLTINECELSCFQFCYFPVCEELKIVLKKHEETGWNDPVAFRVFMAKFPMLQTFKVEGGSMYVKREDTDPAKFQRAPFERVRASQIQRVSIVSYFPVFLRDNGRWIRELSVKFINAEQLSWLLRDLVVLETLNIITIEGRYEGETFEENFSIRNLEVKALSAPWYYYRTPSIMPLFLKALKSISQVLFRFEVMEEEIRFIASNVRSLQKMTCARADDSAIEAYLEIQNSRSVAYINTSFELEILPEPQYLNARREYPYARHDDINEEEENILQNGIAQHIANALANAQ